MDKIRKRRESWARSQKTHRGRKEKLARRILRKSRWTINRAAARVQAKVVAEAAEPEGQKLLVKKVFL